MHLFDASSFIYAWNEYPIVNFPGLWDWMLKEIEASRIFISSVAYEEVKLRSPECGDWLKSCGINRIIADDKILFSAIEIKAVLNIEEEDYHPKGVGENDLIIIATAKTQGLILVTEEGVQNNLPNDSRKMKVPAVCELDEVNVRCCKFREFFAESEEIFG